MFTPRSRRVRLRVGALLALTLVGCAPPSASARARQTHLYEISQAEIEAQLGKAGSAYDIVRRLRPSMLQSRGHEGPQSRSPVWEANSSIKVYLDGLRYGGVESLETIPANTVLEVRWLSATDATIRFGTGNPAGAIAVTSRSGRQ
jgi:hypothetical protein